MCHLQSACIKCRDNILEVDELNSQTKPQNSADSAQGYLKIIVRTASGAIPLEGALVTVRNQDSGETLISYITDRSGNIPTLSLPTAQRALTLTPSDIKPYTSYSADISLRGYYSNLYTSIPIFESITSVQTADLVPLPEDGTADAYTEKGSFIFDAITGERLRGASDE